MIQGRVISSLIAETDMVKKNLNQVDTVTRFTLELWLKIIRKYKFERELILIEWPAYSNKFTPGTQDLRYKQLTNNGMTAWCVLIKDKCFKSFQELKQQFDIMNQDHFRYLQLRNFFNRKIKHIDSNKNDLVEMIIGIYNSKTFRILSSLYKVFLKRSGCTTLDVKQRWETELEIVVTEEEWKYIWITQQSTTSSRIWREHCWKNIIRFFKTPKITAKYKSRVQPCWRECGYTNVNHAHIFWLCPKLTIFWDKVYRLIVKILGYVIPQTCLVLYLGHINCDGINKSDKYLLKILLAACKKAITKKWFKSDPPTTQDWIKIVNGIFEMEILTHRLRTQEENCRDKWDKWTKFTSTRHY